MRKVLKALVGLHEIDGELGRIEREKGDLPQKVDVLQTQVEQAEQQLKSVMIEKAEKQGRQKEIKNELALLGEKLKKYQKQLFQVKTNKEYDAITLETENAQQEIENLEFEELELDEAIQKNDEQIAQLQDQFSALKKDLSENKRELKVMLDKTQKQEDELHGKRSNVLKLLPRQIVSTYDRIRMAKNGAGIAFLKNGACSACSTRIPPQRGLEIRSMDKLFMCEVCGRIMLWKEEPEQTPGGPVE